MFSRIKAWVAAVVRVIPHSIWGNSILSVISENGRQISLRDSQGKTHVIPRDEIEERERQNVSAMPEGLAGSLELQQLADLIAYLQSI